MDAALMEYNDMAEAQSIIEENLADSIAMLEQILEVMPQDADAIKALYSAYRKTGKSEQAFEYLRRLIDVCIGGNDASSVSYIQRELAQFDDVYPSEVAAQNARIRKLADAFAPSRKGTAAPAGKSHRSTGIRSRETDITEELALAWRLYEEGQLEQEEYSSVLHDLTEVSSKVLDVPISVLHVLNDRGFKQMNRLMNHLTNRSGVPMVMLANFELSEDVANVLPIEVVAHDGALPFAFFGDDLLVGVLNPFNNALADKVESISGHRCHTYLVDPEDYDLALGRLRALAAKS
jgi:tetratricopeptide (TPR) repeat protein